MTQISKNTYTDSIKLAVEDKCKCNSLKNEYI